MNQMRILRVICLILAVVVWGASPQEAAADLKKASATLAGCTDSNISGFAFLVERPSDEGVKLVDFTLVMVGLTDGKHAVHIQRDR